MTTATIAGFRKVPLLPHPACPAGPLRALSVSAQLSAAGLLNLDYELRGNLARIRLAPKVSHPQRRDGLWNHTCLELFARGGQGSSYLEFNFSPSGDWAVYRFEEYRSGQSACQQRQIGVTMHAIGADRLRVQACADLDALSADAGTEAPDAASLGWLFNPAAVIEAGDGSLSYWAAHHGGARPDFHAAAGCRVAAR